MIVSVQRDASRFGTLYVRIWYSNEYIKLSNSCPSRSSDIPSADPSILIFSLLKVPIPLPEKKRGNYPPPPLSPCEFLSSLFLLFCNVACSPAPFPLVQTQTLATPTRTPSLQILLLKMAQSYLRSWSTHIWCAISPEVYVQQQTVKTIETHGR